MLEQIQDKFNLLFLNKKEKTYYRACDGCKSTTDLALAILLIAPDLIWSKEYAFRGSDHLSIILREERKNSTKQQQRWSTNTANWTQIKKAL